MDFSERIVAICMLVGLTVGMFGALLQMMAVMVAGIAMAVPGYICFAFEEGGADESERRKDSE